MQFLKDELAPQNACFSKFLGVRAEGTFVAEDEFTTLAGEREREGKGENVPQRGGWVGSDVVTAVSSSFPHPPHTYAHMYEKTKK